MMLCMRYVWALAAGCLLAPAPAHPASGQLVLSCKDEAKSRGMRGQAGQATRRFWCSTSTVTCSFTTGLPGALRLTRSKSTTSLGSLTRHPGGVPEPRHAGSRRARRYSQDDIRLCAVCPTLLQSCRALSELKRLSPTKARPSQKRRHSTAEHTTAPAKLAPAMDNSIVAALVQPAPAFSAVAGRGTGRFLEAKLTAAHAVP